jgi:hypothetical protein
MLPLSRLGFNIYLAQALGHVLGMSFNYFSYSRFAFRDEQGSLARFVGSYALNYRARSWPSVPCRARQSRTLILPVCCPPLVLS